MSRHRDPQQPVVRLPLGPLVCADVTLLVLSLALALAGAR